jgi:hypothetical protein
LEDLGLDLEGIRLLLSMELEQEVGETDPAMEI